MWGKAICSITKCVWVVWEYEALPYQNSKNLINCNIYVGAHRTEDLNDKYLGSGHILINAIKKYGLKRYLGFLLGLHFLISIHHNHLFNGCCILSPFFMLFERTILIYINS